MKTTRINAVVAVSFAWASVASAAPVDCSATACTVSRDGVVIAQSDASEHHLDTISIDGMDHLYSEEFHMDFGTEFPGNNGDQEFDDVFSLDSASQDDITDIIVNNWSETDLTADITQQILSVTENSATIRETISFENTGDGTVQFWFVEYTDWDLFDDADGQIAELTGPATFTQTYPGRNLTATVTASVVPDHFGIAGGVGEDALLVDPGLPHLNGVSGPVGPADVRHGFEYDVSLDSDDIFTVSFDKTLTSATSDAAIPTLNRWGVWLLAVFLGLFGFWYTRKNQKA